MKEFFSLRPHRRKRLVLLLSLFFGLLLFAELMENRNLQRINNDFFSLYEDRLIPASQMYRISELLYEKQLIFELLDENDYRVSSLDLEKIDQENQEIMAILDQYENTLLVEEEKQYLEQFKINLTSYQQLEEELLYHLKEGNSGIAKLLIHTKAREFHTRASADLHRLAQIQPEVGQELLSHYRSSFGSSSTLYYFKIGVTLIIGFLVLRLLGLIHLLHRPKQHFELN